MMRRCSGDQPTEPCNRIDTVCIVGSVVSLGLVVLGAATAPGSTLKVAPSGYIRIVEGDARIESAGQTTVAEPFVPLAIGDVVVVERGRVVVYDMRSGEQFEAHEGTQFTLPTQVPHADRSMRTRFAAALAALMNDPAQTAPAHVRGRRIRPWPEAVRFAPHAYIDFRWPHGLAAPWFVLRRVAPEPRQLLQITAPSAPLRWPRELERSAGSYEWDLLDSGDHPLLSGHFTILSEADAAAQRARYAKTATARFGRRDRDLGIELLAAKDRCFLQ